MPVLKYGYHLLLLTNTIQAAWLLPTILEVEVMLPHWVACCAVAKVEGKVPTRHGR